MSVKDYEWDEDFESYIGPVTIARCKTTEPFKVYVTARTSNPYISIEHMRELSKKLAEMADRLEVEKIVLS